MEHSDSINKTMNSRDILSFIIYFILFVLTIPFILFRHKQYTILSVYLPNLDLIGNLLTFNSKLVKDGLFQTLYLADAPTNTTYITKTLINYMALLGVTYIVAKETKTTGKISYGWSLGFVMLLTTYLLPSRYINDIMKDTVTFTSKYNLNEKLNLTNYNINYLPSLIIGIILVVAVIIFERIIIDKFRLNLVNIAEFIMSIPKHIMPK